VLNGTEIALIALGLAGAPVAVAVAVAFGVGSQPASAAGAAPVRHKRPSMLQAWLHRGEVDGDDDLGGEEVEDGQEPTDPDSSPPAPQVATNPTRRMRELAGARAD
jgi:hypothetical protein